MGLMQLPLKNNFYIVIEANKNLGGCILELSLYTTRGITEHHSDTSVYRRLSKKRALQLNHILRYKASIWLDKHQDAIYKGEWHCMHEVLFANKDKLACSRMCLKTP